MKREVFTEPDHHYISQRKDLCSYTDGDTQEPENSSWVQAYMPIIDIHHAKDILELLEKLKEKVVIESPVLIVDGATIKISIRRKVDVDEESYKHFFTKTYKFFKILDSSDFVVRAISRGSDYSEEWYLKHSNYESKNLRVAASIEARHLLWGVYAVPNKEPIPGLKLKFENAPESLTVEAFSKYLQHFERILPVKLKEDPKVFTTIH